MKIRKSIPFILTAIFLGLFLLSSSSCSQKTYSAKNMTGYKRSDRIKVYKSNSNRNSFVHDKTVRKRYVIKKK